MDNRMLRWITGPLAGVAVCASSQGQIIANGDFETGDFSGWTVFGDATSCGVDGYLPHGGTHAAYFGPLTASGIEQALNAAAGSRLVIEFWLAEDFGETPNSCIVTLDGQTVMSIADFAGTAYQHFTATVTATGNNPVLRFTFVNEPDYFELDDVTVTPDGAPAPCYANCDGSTAAPVINANDFQCFLNRFAAGESYANCDESSAAPVLNANDFQCFLNKCAAGCG